jgi:hypothetical protein
VFKMTKGGDDFAYDIVSEESEQHYKPKCGAIGYCLGWSTPPDHEALKRTQLLRRVMILLFIQLLTVTAICCVALFVDPINTFLVENNTIDSWFFWTGFILGFVLEIITLVVLYFVRKKFPLNVIVLAIFTFVTSNAFIPLSLPFTITNINLSIRPPHLRLFRSN